MHGMACSQAAHQMDRSSHVVQRSGTCFKSSVGLLSLFLPFMQILNAMIVFALGGLESDLLCSIVCVFSLRL